MKETRNKYVYCKNTVITKLTKLTLTFQLLVMIVMIIYSSSRAFHSACHLFFTFLWPASVMAAMLNSWPV